MDIKDINSETSDDLIGHAMDAAGQWLVTDPLSGRLCDLVRLLVTERDRLKAELTATRENAKGLSSSLAKNTQALIGKDFKDFQS